MCAEKKVVRQSVSNNNGRMFLPYFTVVCGMIFALLCVVPTGFAEENAAESSAFAQKKNAAPKSAPSKSKPTPASKNSKTKPTPTPAKTKAKPTPTPAKAKATPTPKKTDAKKTDAKKSDVKKADTKKNDAKKGDVKKASAKAEPKTTAKSTPKTTAKTTAKSTLKPAAKSTPEPSAKKPAPRSTTASANTPSLPIRRFLVTGDETIVRLSPTLSAAEQMRLKLGAIVRIDDRTAQAENIGGKSDFWYRTVSERDKKGWIFGANLVELNGNDNDETIRRVVTHFTNVERTTFEQQVHLNEFITRILPEVKSETFAAELGLVRLQALKASLRLIPAERANLKPYSDWTTSQQAGIIYNEPAGEWIVRSQLYWDLHKRFQNVEPLNEKIAWAAAENPIAGECEGYINCYIYFLRATQGEYLENYPSGAHSAEALKNIADGLAPIIADVKEKTVFTAPTDVSDRAEFYKLISELRTAVSRTTLEGKRAVLDQLNQVAEAYR